MSPAVSAMLERPAARTIHAGSVGNDEAVFTHEFFVSGDGRSGLGYFTVCVLVVEFVLDANLLLT